MELREDVAGREEAKTSNMKVMWSSFIPFWAFNAQHGVSPGAVLWTSGKIYFETTNLLSI